MVRGILGEAERFHVWKAVDGREDIWDGRWRSACKMGCEWVVDLALRELDFRSH